MESIKPAMGLLGSHLVQPGTKDYKDAKRLAAELSALGISVISRGTDGIGQAAWEGYKQAKLLNPKSMARSVLLLLKNGHVEQPTDGDVWLTFKHLFEEKIALARHADLGLAFTQAGPATLDFFFEYLTLIQTGKIQKRPLWLMDKKFFSPWDRWFEGTLQANGLISADDRKLYTFTEDVKETREQIENHYLEQLYKHSSSPVEVKMPPVSSPLLAPVQVILPLIMPLSKAGTDAPAASPVVALRDEKIVQVLAVPGAEITAVEQTITLIAKALVDLAVKVVKVATVNKQMPPVGQSDQDQKPRSAIPFAAIDVSGYLRLGGVGKKRSSSGSLAGEKKQFAAKVNIAALKLLTKEQLSGYSHVQREAKQKSFTSVSGLNPPPGEAGPSHKRLAMADAEGVTAATKQIAVKAAVLTVERLIIIRPGSRGLGESQGGLSTSSIIGKSASSPVFSERLFKPWSLPEGDFYHFSILAYLPNLVEIGYFMPAVHLDFRIEQRIRKRLLKTGYSAAEIEALLPEAKKYPAPYMLDVYRYFWVTSSLRRAVTKSAGAKNRQLFFENQFVLKNEAKQRLFSRPVVYVLDNQQVRGVQLWTEGVVKRLQFFRFLKSLVLPINFVTPENIRIDAVKAVLVDKVDEAAVREFLKGTGLKQVPVIGVAGLALGKREEALTASDIDRIIKASSTNPQGPTGRKETSSSPVIGQTSMVFKQTTLTFYEVSRRMERLFSLKEVVQFAVDKEIKYAYIDKVLAVIPAFKATLPPSYQENMDLLVAILGLPAADASVLLFGIDKILLKKITNLHTKEWTTDIRLKRVGLVLSKDAALAEVWAKMAEQATTDEERAWWLGIAHEIKPNHLDLSSSPVVTFEQLVRQVTGNTNRLSYVDIGAGSIGLFGQNLEAYLIRRGIEVSRESVSFDNAMLNSQAVSEGKVKYADVAYAEDLQAIGLLPGSKSLVFVNNIVNFGLLAPAISLLKTDGRLFVTFAESDIQDYGYEWIVHAREQIEVLAQMDRSYVYEVHEIARPSDYPISNLEYNSSDTMLMVIKREKEDSAKESSSPVVVEVPGDMQEAIANIASSRNQRQREERILDFAAVFASKILAESHWSILLLSRDERFVIKIYKKGDEAYLKYEKERNFYRDINLPGQPVLYHFNDRAKALVLENLEAAGLIDQFDFMHGQITLSQLITTVESAAQALAKIHKSNEKGWISGQQIYKRVMRNLRPAIDSLNREGFEGVPSIESFSPYRLTLSQQKLVYNHGDFSSWNLFVRPETGEVMGVIDAEFSSYAVRTKELATVLVQFLDARKNNPFLIAHMGDVLLRFIHVYADEAGVRVEGLIKDLKFFLANQLLISADFAYRKWQTREWTQWRIALARRILEKEPLSREGLIEVLSAGMEAFNILHVGDVRIGIMGPASGRVVPITKGQFIDVYVPVVISGAYDPWLATNIAAQIWTDVNTGVWHAEGPLEFYKYEPDMYLFKGTLKATKTGRYEFTVRFTTDAKAATELSETPEWERPWLWAWSPFGNTILEVTDTASSPVKPKELELINIQPPSDTVSEYYRQEPFKVSVQFRSSLPPEAHEAWIIARPGKDNWQRIPMALVSSEKGIHTFANTIIPTATGFWEYNVLVKAGEKKLSVKGGKINVLAPKNEVWTQGPVAKEIGQGLWPGHLFVGNIMAAAIAKNLGFEAVLNLAEGKDITAPADLDYRYLPLPDGAHNVIPKQDVKAAVAWLTERLNRGLKVLVNCNAGAARSGSIGISTVYQAMTNLDFYQIISLVKEAKADIYPHVGLVQTLKELDQEWAQEQGTVIHRQTVKPVKVHRVHLVSQKVGDTLQKVSGDTIVIEAIVDYEGEGVPYVAVRTNAKDDPYQTIRMVATESVPKDSAETKSVKYQTRIALEREGKFWLTISASSYGEGIVRNEERTWLGGNLDIVVSPKSGSSTSSPVKANPGNKVGIYTVDDYAGYRGNEEKVRLAARSRLVAALEEKFATVVDLASSEQPDIVDRFTTDHVLTLYRFLQKVENEQSIRLFITGGLYDNCLFDVFVVAVNFAFMKTGKPLHVTFVEDTITQSGDYAQNGNSTKRALYTRFAAELPANTLVITDDTRTEKRINRSEDYDLVISIFHDLASYRRAEEQLSRIPLAHRDSESLQALRQELNGDAQQSTLTRNVSSPVQDNTLRNSQGESLRQVLGRVAKHLAKLSPAHYWTPEGDRQVAFLDFVAMLLSRSETIFTAEKAREAARLEGLTNVELERELARWYRYGDGSLESLLDEMSEASGFVHHLRSPFAGEVALHNLKWSELSREDQEQTMALIRESERRGLLIAEILRRWDLSTGKAMKQDAGRVVGPTSRIAAFTPTFNSKEYYRIAQGVLSKAGFAQFMAIHDFYGNERYQLAFEVTSKIKQILRQAPMVKEVYGVGYPFYGNVDIRLRLSQTMEKLIAQEITEAGFLARITPDFDMVLVVKDDDNGPWQIREKMDAVFAEQFVNYATVYRRAWAAVNARLKDEANMADLFHDDKGQALALLLSKGKYSLDIVFVPEHAWNETVVFVKTGDDKYFKYTRDLLFSLTSREENTSLVPVEFLQNYLLNILSEGAVEADVLFVKLAVRQPHGTLLALYEEAAHIVRGKMEQALTRARDRGLVSDRGHKVSLTAKGKQYLEAVLAHRQKLLSEGYDMEGQSFISNLVALETRLGLPAAKASKDQTPSSSPVQEKKTALKHGIDELINRPLKIVQRWVALSTTFVLTSSLFWTAIVAYPLVIAGLLAQYFFNLPVSIIWVGYVAPVIGFLIGLFNFFDVYLNKHFTGFFRDRDFYQKKFAEDLLPYLKNKPAGPINIHSAGASDFREAVTVAITLLEDYRKQPETWQGRNPYEDVVIYATEINPRVFAKGVQFTYTFDELFDKLTNEEASKYFNFLKVKDQFSYQLKPKVRQMIKPINRDLKETTDLRDIDLVLFLHTAYLISPFALSKVLSNFKESLSDRGLIVIAAGMTTMNPATLLIHRLLRETVEKHTYQPSDETKPGYDVYRFEKTTGTGEDSTSQPTASSTTGDKKSPSSSPVAMTRRGFLKLMTTALAATAAPRRSPAQNAVRKTSVIKQPEIKIFYVLHRDQSDFERIVPDLNNVLLTARMQGQRTYVYIENSIWGDYSPEYVRRKFAREFSGWDIDRVISDLGYRERFRKHYISYLTEQLIIVNSRRFQTRIKDSTDTRAFLAEYRYFSRKIIDEGYDIALRLEEPSFNYVLNIIQGKDAGALEDRDEKLFNDIQEVLTSHDTVIVIRGAMHTYLEDLFKAKGLTPETYIDAATQEELMLHNLWPRTPISGEEDMLLHKSQPRGTPLSPTLPSEPAVVNITDYVVLPILVISGIVIWIFGKIISRRAKRLAALEAKRSSSAVQAVLEGEQPSSEEKTQGSSDNVSSPVKPISPISAILSQLPRKLWEKLSPAANKQTDEKEVPAAGDIVTISDEAKALLAAEAAHPVFGKLATNEDFLRVAQAEVQVRQTVGESMVLQQSTTPRKEIRVVVYAGNTRLGRLTFDVVANPVSGRYAADNKLGRLTRALTPNPISSQHDYYRATGLVVINSALTLDQKTKAKQALTVPLSPTSVDKGLGDDQLFSVFSAAILTQMQLLGEKVFTGRKVAIAGVGNGVDALLALRSGAEELYLFDSLMAVKKNFAENMTLNQIQSTAKINDQYLGWKIESLPPYGQEPVDIILLNQPHMGLPLLPALLSFFHPAGSEVLLILTGEKEEAMPAPYQEYLTLLRRYARDTVSIFEEDSKGARTYFAGALVIPTVQYLKAIRAGKILGVTASPVLTLRTSFQELPSVTNVTSSPVVRPSVRPRTSQGEDSTSQATASATTGDKKSPSSSPVEMSRRGFLTLVTAKDIKRVLRSEREATREIEESIIPKVGVVEREAVRLTIDAGEPDLGRFTLDLNKIIRGGRHDYYRAAGLVVANSDLGLQPEIASKRLVTVPLYPESGKWAVPHENLYSNWTGALLTLMQLFGRKIFIGRQVGVAGVGNGIDALLALKLGARAVHLLDISPKAALLMKENISRNQVRTAARIHSEYLGQMFEFLPPNGVAPVDIILLNEGKFGLGKLSQLLAFFRPAGQDILLVLTGDYYDALPENYQRFLRILMRSTTQIVRVNERHSDNKPARQSAFAFVIPAAKYPMISLLADSALDSLNPVSSPISNEETMDYARQLNALLLSSHSLSETKEQIAQYIKRYSLKSSHETAWVTKNTPLIVGFFSQEGLTDKSEQYFVLTIAQMLLTLPPEQGGASSSPIEQFENLMVAMNLMDIGAELVNGEVIYKDSLKKARELLPLLAEGGVGRVYLYGGLYEMSRISEDVHQVPTEGRHFITHENVTVKVQGYHTNRKTVSHIALRDNHGNPFSELSMLRLNAKLSTTDVRQDFAEFMAEAKRLGIKVIVDFIPWLAPDAINAQNYKWTFYQELTKAENDYFRSLPEPKKQDFINTLVVQNDSFFAVRITEAGQERVILVKHFTPWGINVDQVKLNIFEPQVQQYYIDTLKSLSDLGVDGVRVDLAQEILKEYMGMYVSLLSQDQKEHAEKAKELWERIFAAVKTHEVSQGKEIEFIMETYDKDRLKLLAMGADRAYNKDVYDAFKGIVLGGVVRKNTVDNSGLDWKDVSDKLTRNGWAVQVNSTEIQLVKNWQEQQGPMAETFGGDFTKLLAVLHQAEGWDEFSAKTLNAAVRYSLYMKSKFVVFPSNFDELPLKSIGGAQRGFKMLLLTLLRIGIPLMVDLREWMDHSGQLIPVVNHNFLNAEELARRPDSHGLKSEVERSPWPALIAEVAKAVPHAGETYIQTLDTLNQDKLFAFAWQTPNYHWQILIFNTKPQNETEGVWVELPSQLISAKKADTLKVYDAVTGRKISTYVLRENGREFYRMGDIVFKPGEEYKILSLVVNGDSARLSPAAKASSPVNALDRAALQAQPLMKTENGRTYLNVNKFWLIWYEATRRMTPSINTVELFGSALYLAQDGWVDTAVISDVDIYVPQLEGFEFDRERSQYIFNIGPELAAQDASISRVHSTAALLARGWHDTKLSMSVGSLNLNAEVFFQDITNSYRMADLMVELEKTIRLLAGNNLEFKPVNQDVYYKLYKRSILFLRLAGQEWESRLRKVQEEALIKADNEEALVALRQVAAELRARTLKITAEDIRERLAPPHWVIGPSPASSPVRPQPSNTLLSEQLEKAAKALHQMYETKGVDFTTIREDKVPDVLVQVVKKEFQKALRKALRVLNIPLTSLESQEVTSLENNFMSIFLRKISFHFQGDNEKDESFVESVLFAKHFLTRSIKNIYHVSRHLSDFVHIEVRETGRGSRKVVYRVDLYNQAESLLGIKDMKPAFSFALKLELGYPGNRRTTWAGFQRQEVRNLKLLSEKARGKTPQFGVYLRQAGRRAYSEEFIDGITAANKRLELNSARTREITNAWLAVGMALEESLEKARTEGRYVTIKDMQKPNIMYRRQDKKLQGQPVVVDIGQTERKTPYTIVRALYRHYPFADGIVAGVLDIFGPTEGRVFLLRVVHALSTQRLDQRDQTDESILTALNNQLSKLGSGLPGDIRDILMKSPEEITMAEVRFLAAAIADATTPDIVREVLVSKVTQIINSPHPVLDKEISNVDKYAPPPGFTATIDLTPEQVQKLKPRPSNFSWHRAEKEIVELLLREDPIDLNGDGTIYNGNNRTIWAQKMNAPLRAHIRPEDIARLLDLVSGKESLEKKGGTDDSSGSSSSPVEQPGTQNGKIGLFSTTEVFTLARQAVVDIEKVGGLCGNHAVWTAHLLTRKGIPAVVYEWNKDDQVHYFVRIPGYIVDSFPQGADKKALAKHPNYGDGVVVVIPEDAIEAQDYLEGVLSLYDLKGSVLRWIIAEIKAATNNSGNGGKASSPVWTNGDSARLSERFVQKTPLKTMVSSAISSDRRLNIIRGYHQEFRAELTRVPSDTKKLKGLLAQMESSIDELAASKDNTVAVKTLIHNFNEQRAALVRASNLAHIRQAAQTLPLSLAEQRIVGALYSFVERAKPIHLAPGASFAKRQVWKAQTDAFSRQIDRLLRQFPVQITAGSSDWLEDIFAEVLMNSYDAIASVFDPTLLDQAAIPGGYQGRITVSYELVNEERQNNLVVVVTDNGLGSRAARKERKQEKSYVYFGGKGVGAQEASRKLRSIGGEIIWDIAVTGASFSGQVKTLVAMRIPLDALTIKTTSLSGQGPVSSPVSDEAKDEKGSESQDRGMPDRDHTHAATTSLLLSRGITRVQNILVLCNANRNRSPLLAWTLNRGLPREISVHSAGVSVRKPKFLDKNDTQDDDVQDILKMLSSADIGVLQQTLRRFYFSEHIMKPVTADMVAGADLILIMTVEQIRKLEKNFAAETHQGQKVIFASRFLNPETVNQLVDADWLPETQEKLKTGKTVDIKDMLRFFEEIRDNLTKELALLAAQPSGPEGNVSSPISRNNGYTNNKGTMDRQRLKELNAQIEQLEKEVYATGDFFVLADIRDWTEKFKWGNISAEQYMAKLKGVLVKHQDFIALLKNGGKEDTSASSPVTEKDEAELIRITGELRGLGLRDEDISKDEAIVRQALESGEYYISGARVAILGDETGRPLRALTRADLKKETPVVGALDVIVARLCHFCFQAADTFVFSPDRRKVVLIRRSNNPFMYHLTNPGGVVLTGSYEATARREVMEELNLTAMPAGPFQRLYTDLIKQADGDQKAVTYAYTLTPEEFLRVQQVRDDIEALKAQMTRKEFVALLRNKEKEREGYGDALGIHLVQWEQLLSPIRARKTKLMGLMVQEPFKGETHAAEFAPFTPDCLQRTLEHKKALKAILHYTWASSSSPILGHITAGNKAHLLEEKEIPAKDSFFKLIQDMILQLPKDQRTAYLGLQAIFVSIEATFGLAKWLAVILIGAGGIFGHSFAGILIGGLVLHVGGIARIIMTMVFMKRYPQVSFAKVLHPATLLPFYIGFAYAMWALASKVSNGNGVADLWKLRNIAHKIYLSLYYSGKQKAGLREPLAIGLRNHVYEIAEDILNYQRKYLSLENSGKQRLFRIRSTQWDEEKIRKPLQEGKSLLLLDSSVRVKAFKRILKAKFGRDYLKRMYYFDTEAFFSVMAEQRGYQKETFIQPLFPNGKQQKSATSSPVKHPGWILNGRPEDIAADGYRVPRDIRLPVKYTEIVGLQNKVVIELTDGRTLMVTDDHNHVYTFWWLMMKLGKVSRSGNSLLHVDAHADAELTSKYREASGDHFFRGGQELAEVDRYSKDILGIEGFIAPLVENGFIAVWHWIYNLEQKIARGMEKATYRYQIHEQTKQDVSTLDYNLLDIDIDVLNGMNQVEAETALIFFAQLAQKAKLISIATSPNFIDQEKAIDYAKRLVAMIERSSSSPVGEREAKASKKGLFTPANVFAGARQSALESQTFVSRKTSSPVASDRQRITHSFDAGHLLVYRPDVPLFVPQRYARITFLRPKATDVERQISGELESGQPLTREHRYGLYGQEVISSRETGEALTPEEVAWVRNIPPANVHTDISRETYTLYGSELFDVHKDVDILIPGPVDGIVKHDLGCA